MSVDVTFEVEIAGLDETRVAEVVASVIEAESSTLSLSVVIVDDQTIHDVNRRFLDHDYPTDVISFDLSDEGPGVDGEVVASWTTALREAGSRRIDPIGELLLYCIHGTLHLLGYDDKDDEDRRLMHARQRELLAMNGYETSE